MVGVGSGSALNAFNIGQQATQPTAVGTAIKNIVDNADKQGLLAAQSEAQTAGSLATAHYKNQLANAPQDVYVPGQGGGLTIIKGVPGGGKNVESQQSLPGILPGIGTGITPTQPGAGQVRRYDSKGNVVEGGAPAAGGQPQYVDVPGLGAIDPNAELTEEQVAAIKAAFPGL